MSFYIWGHANGILTIDLEVVWIGCMAWSGKVDGERSGQEASLIGGTQGQVVHEFSI